MIKLSRFGFWAVLVIPCVVFGILYSKMNLSIFTLIAFILIMLYAVALHEKKAAKKAPQFERAKINTDETN